MRPTSGGRERPEFLCGQRGLPKACEHAVEAVEGHDIGVRDLDSEGTAIRSAIDHKESIQRGLRLGALLSSRVRKVQVGRERPAFAVGDLQRSPAIAETRRP